MSPVTDAAGTAGPRIPDRIRAAVRLLEVRPDDEILEIGCGPGVAVQLVCERLDGGHITAIDRSPTAVRRACERNAAHIASGKAVVRQADAAALALGNQRFDTVFAVNVNLFWVRSPEPELQIIKLLLRPGGVLRLFYETPGTGDPTSDKTGRVTRAVTSALRDHGFSTEVSTSSPVLCISGRRDDPV